MLTGLGCTAFDESVRAIIEIHSRFDTLLPSNSLQPWNPVNDNETLCLEFSNRYFTPEFLASGYDDASIPTVVDPLGLLQGKCGTGRHTEDNQVFYYEKISHIDNQFSNAIIYG